MMLLFVFLAFFVGYISGSIPFGLLIAKLGGAGDVRAIGSGNIGATNVLRTGRKGLAAATLIVDALKGYFPVFLFIHVDILPACVAAVGAFIGHLFPVWLKFKGGKGVATYIGALLPFSWVAIAAFALVWLTTAALTRFSSLAALLALIAAPLALWWSVESNGLPAATFALLSAIAWWRHRENISRLRKGQESKIGSKG